MPQPTIVTQAPRRLIAGSISRRVVLAGGTGVVAAADLAVRSALAQGTPTPGMPAVQAPVRQEWLDKPLCCTDQQLGEVSPPHRHLFETNVFRPPKLQHTVERRDSNGHLGRLPPFGPRAQRVTNHSLVAADIGFY